LLWLAAVVAGFGMNARAGKNEPGQSGGDAEKLGHHSLHLVGRETRCHARNLCDFRRRRSVGCHPRSSNSCDRIHHHGAITLARTKHFAGRGHKGQDRATGEQGRGAARGGRMGVVVVVFAVVAAAAWIAMAIAALRMLRYRRRSILWLGMNGWAFFQGDSFAPEAAKYRRHFLRAAAAFVVAIVFAAGAAVLAALSVR